MAETGLRLRCPMSQCKTIKFTAPTGGKVAGQLYAVGSLVGVVVEDVDAGEEGVLIYSAPKVIVDARQGTSYVFTAGDKVYYRSAGPDVTPASTGNTLIGRALEDTAAADEEVLIDLHGDIEA